MRRCRTSGGRRAIWTLSTVANRHMSGCKIDNRSRNEKWRNLAWPPLQILRMLAFDHVESTDPGGDVHARRIRKFRFHFKASHLHREFRSRESQLDEPAHLFQFFFLNPYERIKIAHFTGDAAVKRCGIKMSDWADTTFSGQQVAPDLIGPNAAPADQPYARHDDSAVQTCILLFGMGRPGGLLTSLGVFLDVVNGVFYRGDFLGVFVRDLNAERFLESHDQLDCVERIGAQVVHKRGRRSDFAFVHTELLDDNLLHAFFDAGHSDFSSGIGSSFASSRHDGRGSAQICTAHSMRGPMLGSTSVPRKAAIKPRI